MPYTFKQGDETLSTTMESFWLYCSFAVEDQTNVVTIQDGYLAVYFSQQNDHPEIRRPKRDAGVNCAIERDPGSQRKIELKNLSLIGSRLSEYANERSYLHLYRFEVNHLPDWIGEPIGWQANYRNPAANDDHTPLLDRHVSFGSVKDRHVYWTSVEESFRSIKTLSLATAFTGDQSLFKSLIAAHNEPFPTLTLTSDWHGTEYQFPSTSDEVPDTAHQGFAMIAEGAFAALPLASELDSSVEEDSWLFGRGAGAGPILKRLSNLVFNYPTEALEGGLRRYLFQSKNSAASSVIPTTRDNPFELLHIRGMNDERMSSVISDKR
jgi:hypothetical protein